MIWIILYALVFIIHLVVVGYLAKKRGWDEIKVPLISLGGIIWPVFYASSVLTFIILSILSYGESLAEDNEQEEEECQ